MHIILKIIYEPQFVKLEDGIDGHRTLGDKLGLAGKRDMGQEEDFRTGTLRISNEDLIHIIIDFLSYLKLKVPLPCHPRISDTSSWIAICGLRVGGRGGGSRVVDRSGNGGSFVALVSDNGGGPRPRRQLMMDPNWRQWTMTVDYSGIRF
ncbi:unnamed protein product [Pleuronectes platessa]|uniref:Galanin peptides n=1 Tax=Pleuronectes platessa TaxID=8262 RepID=A0A9N7ZDT7_PLEPL|nr:unnamed protein product [Pleuronectes platessa]